MRTPSPVSETSHSIAAAALLQLSQTPPQPVVKTCGDMSTPSSLQQRSTVVASPIAESSQRGQQGQATVGTCRSPKSNVHIFSSPLSDSIGIVKVSNRDDEDTDVQAHDVRHGYSFDTSRAPNEGSRTGPPVPEAVSNFTLNNTPMPTSVPGLAVMRRLHNAKFQWSSYTPVEETRDANAAGPVSARPSDGSGRWGTQVPQTAYPILTIGPDELESYMRNNASFSRQGQRTSLGPASTPFDFPFPAQQVGSQPFLMEQQHISQPSIQIQNMLPPTSVDARAPQQSEPVTSIEKPFAQFASYGVLGPGRASLEMVEGPSKVKNPRAPPQAPASKRVKIPPSVKATSASRDGFGAKQINIRDFKYRTIKAINLPARTDVTPGQQPPEPMPDSCPYGYDVDYRASVLIWWCDDLELSYSETVRRYRIKFTDEKTITEDTVRKRHILYLELLARKYGLKPEEELEVPGGRVANRGKQLGHKYNTINGVRVYSAAAGHDVAGTVRRQRAGNEPTQHKGFLKACICIWKDTLDVSFEEIKDRLQNDYNWNIGENTVKKLYYSERARVYDTYNNSGATDQEGRIKTADEDLDQLQVHYQQRIAYLIKTHSQQIPADDVAYMQQLEQLIASKKQDQLQRAQQMGSGSTRPIEQAVEVPDAAEGAKVEKKDAMMQDAEPGMVGDQDID